MIYQFEYGEIEYCSECPMNDFANDKCELSGKYTKYNSKPKENNCPMVAIPKTETTRVVSDGFSYDAKLKQFQCLFCLDYFYMPRVGKYCPNCGRKLKGETT